MLLDTLDLPVDGQTGATSDDPMDMREIHVTLLNLLQVIVDLCENHEIDYFLIGGGCLGIARHDHKIIPWDDDLDISIWANDMPRFIRAAQELPPRYRLTSTAHALNPIFKISDTSTRIEFTNPEQRQLMCADSVFVDIVPMMHWPSLAWKRIDDYYTLALSISQSTYSPTPWKGVVKKILYYSGLAHLVIFFGRWFYEPLAKAMDRRCRAQKTGFVSGAIGQKWIGRYPWQVIFPLKKRHLGSDGNTGTVLVNSPNDLHAFVRLRYGKNCMQQPKAEILWKHFDRAVRIKP